jgi:endonuclease/exonuclease/phosphatase family metal-dependent hydrolase
MGTTAPMAGRCPGRSVALLVALLLVVALTWTAPASAQPASTSNGARQVTVATYNVDFGTNLAPLFGISDPAALMAAADAAYRQMVGSNYPERAAAIADLIAKERPDVVGLQEIATWETLDLTRPQPQYEVAHAFQPLLLAELAARGVPYEVAVSNVTFRESLPISPTTVVRFTDLNLILVRSGAPDRILSTSNPQEGRFLARIPLLNLGVFVTRGWASLDVTVRGRTFRFFTTHLEAYSELVRNLQAAELAAMVALSPHPVVVTGDINSRPTCTGINTGAYDILTLAGLVEVWPEVHESDRCGGFTSGQKSLAHPMSTLDHRIDDIFFEPSAMDAVRAEVVGEEEKDRTDSGLWPSDHAGSVATLRFGPA